MPELRTSDILFVFLGIQFRRAEAYNFGIAQKLPSYRYFIERYLTLKQDYETETRFHGAQEAAQYEVLREIHGIWCYLKFYPRLLKSLVRNFKIFFKEFHYRI